MDLTPEQTRARSAHRAARSSRANPKTRRVYSTRKTGFRLGYARGAREGIVLRQMPRSARIRLSLSALRHNLCRVRQLAPQSRVWAVVKADAYGHSLQRVSPALESADGLALVEFDRAQELREAGWRKPLLMLEGAFDRSDTELAAAIGLSLVVHEWRQIEWLSTLPVGSRVNVHLKLNSGMNRLGFPAAEFLAAFERLRSLPPVESITLMTHFANADLPRGAESQGALFDRATAGLPGARSLANSAAIIDCPDTHRDWVRPGIMLYGASPFAGRSAASLGLLPVMRFESRLISIQQLAAGDSVGYGSSFVASGPMAVGIVACGYADGYPRHAPTGTPVAVAGTRTRTIGRVSMDMLAVDLSAVPDAVIGSEVELWGSQVPVDEVAEAAGTIAYELTCAIAPRVARFAFDDGAR